MEHEIYIIEITKEEYDDLKTVKSFEKKMNLKLDMNKYRYGHDAIPNAFERIYFCIVKGIVDKRYPSIAEDGGLWHGGAMPCVLDRWEDDYDIIRLTYNNKFVCEYPGFIGRLGFSNAVRSHGKR